MITCQGVSQTTLLRLSRLALRSLRSRRETTRENLASRDTDHITWLPPSPEDVTCMVLKLAPFVLLLEARRRMVCPWCSTSSTTARPDRVVVKVLASTKLVVLLPSCVSAEADSAPLHSVHLSTLVRCENNVSLSQENFRTSVTTAFFIHSKSALAHGICLCSGAIATNSCLAHPSTASKSVSCPFMTFLRISPTVRPSSSGCHAGQISMKSHHWHSGCFLHSNCPDFAAFFIPA